MEFYLPRGYFSKTERRLQQNPPSDPEDVENCRSRVLFVAFDWLLGQILVENFQDLTTHKGPLLQGNLFLLVVYTHEVSLYLRFIFVAISRSLKNFAYN